MNPDIMDSRDSMITEYDGSLQGCEDILKIDKETFDEIKADATKLQAILAHRGTYRVLIAYVGEEPAAFIGLMVASTPHYEGLWVDLLATRPQFQDQGLATALTQQALKIAELEKLDCVTAIVRPSNHSSMVVFDKLGFRHSAEDYTLLSKEISTAS
ncbi:MAG TPA: GNAT family N-acetyltransferase [Anaerolineaceae bacterium]|nr:GNAT family N-acetyltransferase [Anaerolineaceae bacterium]